MSASFRGFTPGLGAAVCAVCLEELIHEGLVAKKRRFEWNFIGTPAHTGTQVEVGEDYAHAGCALEATNSGWEIA